MLLKQISLLNFKSYKGTTRVLLEDGKTFLAVNFVLGTRNTVLGQLHRMQFFNNGRDNVKLVVEIVLDDEGTLFGDMKITRILGIRSDRLYVNGDRVTRNEFGFMMEICGFSLNAPYYILTNQMMKVLVLPNSKDRLKAFIECIGLCVSRAVTFLDETFMLLEDMRELISECDDVLNEFDTEDVDEAAAKLREHKKLIKERALMKVRLYYLSVKRYENLLKAESESVSRKKDHAHYSASEVHELRCQITTSKLAFEKAKHGLATSQLLLNDLEAERESLLKDKARLTLKIEDLEEKIGVEEGNVSREGSESSRSGFTSVHSEQTELEREFEQISSEFARERNEVEALGKLLNEQKLQLKNMILKKACRSKFSTTDDKEQWINNEVKKLDKTYEENVVAVQSITSKIEELKLASDCCEDEIRVYDQEFKNLRSALKESSTIKNKISELHIELNELQRQENSAAVELDPLMKFLKSKKTELIFKVGNSAFDGFVSAKKAIASQGPLEPSMGAIPVGCYGTVLQNFSCGPSLNLAVDAAAGNRLLAQIVNTDILGTAIMRRMNSLNLPGEVCFFPLNRIVSPPPLSSSQDGAVPLINQLKFPQAVQKAMNFVFGRIMLCRDLQVASQVARELGCACVTLDGDRVNCGGPISGGFIDPKRSTISLFADFEEAESSYRNQIASVKSIRTKIDEKKSEIDSAMSQMLALQRKSQRGGDRRILSQRIETLKAEERQCHEQLKLIESDNQNILRTRQGLLQSAQDTEGLLLNEEEEARAIKELNQGIFDQTKAWNKRVTHLAVLESKVASLERELANSKEAVALKAIDVNKLKILRQKLTDLKTREKIVTSCLAAVEGKMSLASASINSNQLKLRKLECELEEQKKQLRHVEGESGGLNVSLAQERVTNLERKIQELELLREQEMKNHNVKEKELPTHLSVQEIRQKLIQLNDAIERTESAPLMSARAIRKMKAFLRLKRGSTVEEDCFASFYVSMWELMPWVQCHIQYCLENIAELYSHYFSMMVEDGSGSIILEASRCCEEEKVVALSGISLRNQFSGGPSLSQMQLLSQGQKVVVMLSIVFAFMKRQQMGFCIMDEVDQSLSPGHIHGMMRAMAEFEHHQFLISSHNKNTVPFGDHFYQLQFIKSSSMKPTSRSEAMKLIEDLLNQSNKPSTSLVTSSQQSDSSQFSTSSISASHSS